MKYQIISLVIISLLIIFVFAQAAKGQVSNCTKRDVMVEMLNKTHGESVVVAAHSNGNGSMLEFLGRSDGTTWTIIITYNNNLACVTAAGDWWMIPKDANITKPIGNK